MTTTPAEGAERRAGKSTRNDMTPAADKSPITASLPLSKLRGLSTSLRVALKARRITNCDQLLAIAATADARRRFCAEAGLDGPDLLHLVRRADMARVKGVGAVFGMMLEELGVADVPSLAAAKPALLHERLRSYNSQERIARRSPTLGEVEAWIEQARSLPRLVS
jgi:predicted flap endonuclease-1-like 5' DNA nuclease